MLSIGGGGKSPLTNTGWDDERAVDELVVFGDVDLLGLSELDEEVEGVEWLDIRPILSAQFIVSDLISAHLDVHASGHLVVWCLELYKSYSYIVDFVTKKWLYCQSCFIEMI